MALFSQQTFVLSKIPQKHKKPTTTAQISLQRAHGVLQRAHGMIQRFHGMIQRTHGMIQRTHGILHRPHRILHWVFLFLQNRYGILFFGYGILLHYESLILTNLRLKKICFCRFWGLFFLGEVLRIENLRKFFLRARA